MVVVIMMMIQLHEKCMDELKCALTLGWQRTPWPISRDVHSLISQQLPNTEHFPKIALSSYNMLKHNYAHITHKCFMPDSLQILLGYLLSHKHW
jgi:hypothetical protein